MTDIRTNLRRSVYLLIAGSSALLLLASLLVDVTWTIATSTSGTPDTAGLEAGSEPVVRKSPEIAPLLARPIFHATRKPYEAPKHVAAPQASRGPVFRLEGIAEGGSGSWAYLQIIASGETRRVVAGDMIEGWEVVAIEPDIARLIQGGEELALEVEKPAERDTSRRARVRRQ